MHVDSSAHMDVRGSGCYPLPAQPGTAALVHPGICCTRFWPSHMSACMRACCCCCCCRAATLLQGLKLGLEVAAAWLQRCLLHMSGVLLPGGGRPVRLSSCAPVLCAAMLVHTVHAGNAGGTALAGACCGACRGFFFFGLPAGIPFVVGLPADDTLSYGLWCLQGVLCWRALARSQLI